MADDLTTLICLFHHQDQAHAALQDLLQAGIPQASISLVGDSAGNARSANSTLETLGVPERDHHHLLDGLQSGGIILTVSSASEHVDTVEKVFSKHSAAKIDEAALETAEPYAAPIAQTATAATAIPIVAEELVVGKRQVSQGGVRLYRRIVEVPVEESVSLHAEHVQVERHPVDRAVTEQDRAFSGDRTIELTETAEEAVVGKSARVVEEVRLGKQSSDHVETIHDTVRQTEVEIEEIAPATGTGTIPRQG